MFLLTVRIKSSNRAYLRAEFLTKAEAESASLAILRGNMIDRFVCEISFQIASAKRAAVQLAR